MRLLVILVLFLCSSLSLNAQDTYDVITAENASQLIKLRSWTPEQDNRALATFSPDGSELAIFLNAGRVEFVSPETLEVIRTVEGIETEADRLTYSADGRELLLSRLTGEYTLIDVESGAIITTNSNVETPYQFTPMPDVRKYILSDYRVDGISIRDTVTREELLYIPDADGSQWSTNAYGTLLLARHPDGMLKVWDIATGEMIFEFQRSEMSFLDGVGFAANGLIWVAYRIVGDSEFIGSIIQFRDIQTGEIVLELEGSEAYSRLIFDPTMSYVIAKGIFSCDSWNLSTLEQIPCLTGDNFGSTFTRDGHLFALHNASQDNISIFRIGETLDRLATLQPTPHGMLNLALMDTFLLP